MILRGLTIDNGGSEVRTLPIDGDIDKMSNDFVTIEKRDFRVKEIEDKLELCNVLKAPKEAYLGIVARGAAGRLYDAKAMTFDSQSTKTSSTNYYRQIVYAIARDAMKATLKGEQQDTEDIDFDYVITTCIPIKEHSGKNDCATKLKAALSGEYTVEFPLFDEPRTITFKIRPECIGVVPEGGVAVAALKDQLTPDDISLVIDMGHVSVDIAIFKGKTMYGDKVISSPYAGSTLIALLRSALADEGYSVNDSQVQRILETGVVKHGAQEVDAIDIVNAQKGIYVRNFLKKEILSILNMNAINAKQVQYLVPIGAGMNNPEREGSIVRELALCCGLSSAAVKVLSKDLRYVNVEQTALFAKALYRRASRTV